MRDFVEIEGYPNYFIRHSPPKVVRLVDGEYVECKQTPNSKRDNYWTVTLKNGAGEYKKNSVHRLLMLTFVPNPDNKAHVNHIDGDKSNNSMDNLEWATPKENARHAIALGLTDVEASNKEVHQYSLSGEYIASFPSGVVASSETGVEAANIRTVAGGRREQAGFFQWKYHKEEKIPPINTKYVDHYVYKGNKYGSLRELAEYLGINNPHKAGMKYFTKDVRQDITTVYRK